MPTDFKLALRQLAKAPGFTAVIVLSLGLGIAANTTVFCWIQGILLNPVPGVAHQEQLVVLTTIQDRQMYDTVSYPDLKDYRELDHVFSGIIGSQITPASLTVGDHSDWLYGQIVTANFFQVLGVEPIIGRTFRPDEDQKPGGNPVLVLSESYWRRHFDANPAVVGRTVELNLHPFTIIGVVPTAFRGTMSGLVFDFWTPVSMYREVANFGSWDNRDDHWLHVQARLQPGVSIPAAQTAVDVVGARLEQNYPLTNHQVRLRVLTFGKAPYGIPSIFGSVLPVLLAVSIGVLLIVTANVASLLLARAVTRQKEIAIRLAMGANRRKLIRLLLSESLLLSALGGILGAVLAGWSIGLLNAWLPPTNLPISISTKVNLATLGFTAGVTLVVGIVFGLAPALQASRCDLIAALKEGGRESNSGRPRHRLRSLLVVGEFALAMMVLVGAGLCIKSYYRARHSNLGFNPDNVLLVGLRIGMNGYTEATASGFYARLEQQLATLPGVQAAALNDSFPLGFERGGMHLVTVDGYPRRPGENAAISCTTVSPNYFSVMRIPLLEGRDFNDRDDKNAPRVAVINEAMARRFWPGQSPLGRKFRDLGREVTVIGVTTTGKYWFINESPRCFYFLPYRQYVNLNLSICLRTTQDPARLAALMPQVVHQVDPRVEVWVTIRLSDFIKAAFAAPVLASRVLSWLAAVALALAAMGVYGVMAYSVNQRKNEIGMRMALGAQRSDVLRLILWQGSQLAFAGLIAGLAGALLLTRLVVSILYGTRADDPPTFIAASLLLGGMALAACFLPAWKATNVDPMKTLRAE